MDFPVVKDLRRGGGNRRRGRGRRGGRGGQHSAGGRVVAAAESKGEAAAGELRTSGGSEDEDPEEEEEEATFGRRQVRSNWDRYDEERRSDAAAVNDGATLAESAVSSAQFTGGDDYHDVLQRAGTAASQPRLDDDSIPASAAAAATALTHSDPTSASLPTSFPQSLADEAGRLKRIDMTAVLDSVHRLPVGVRLLLGSEAEDYLRSRAHSGDGSGSDNFKHYWCTKAQFAAQPSSASADAAPKAPARLARPAAEVAVGTVPSPSHHSRRAEQPAAAAAAAPQKRLGSRGKRGQHESAASSDSAAALVPESKPQQTSSQLSVHMASRPGDGMAGKSSSQPVVRTAEVTAASVSGPDSALPPKQQPRLASTLASASQAASQSSSRAASSVVVPSGIAAVSLPTPTASAVVPASAKSLEDELDELLAL